MKFTKNFNIITYNVKGIRERVKRNKIFKYIKEKLKDGIAFFQETHSIENDLAIWRNEWDGEIFINHGTSNSKGVMIGISRDLEYNVLKYDCDEEGRIQILSIIYKDTKFLLINIYNENTEPKQVSLFMNLMLKL